MGSHVFPTISKGFMLSLVGFHVFPAISKGFMFSLVGVHVFPIRARGQRNPSTTKSLLTSRCPRTDVELRRQGLIPWYCVARCINLLILPSRRFHTQSTGRARIGAATSKQTQHCLILQCSHQARFLLVLTRVSCISV